jgi:uncharacterized protein
VTRVIHRHAGCDSLYYPPLTTEVPRCPTTDSPHRRPPRGFRRVLYVALGLFFVALGVVGAVLPLLPTTPFLLLAGFFFARSSRRLNDWLLRNRLFGPIIRDWQTYRGVRLKVKIVALTMLPVVVFTSAYFGNLPLYLVVMLISLACVGAVVVIRLPLVREVPPTPPAQPELAGERVG